MHPILFATWVDENHEVIGALLTLVAVCLALWQHFWTNHKENLRFKRQGRAARAAMSLQLSAVIHHCQELLKSIEDPSEFEEILRGQNVATKPPPPPPAIPDGVIETFKEVIISTDRDDVIDRISTLLSHLQIIHSNLKFNHDTHGGALINKRNHLNRARIVILYAVTYTLFDFARNEEKGKALEPVTWDVAHRAMASLYLYQNLPFEQYFAELRRGLPNGPLSIYDKH